ncbi:MAG: hypothetical protein WCY06_10095 [Flavobacteriaceae bacterium]
MKNIKSILVILSCATFLVSCEKEENENPDFYNTDYRIGLWVSPDKKDTLKFVNSSKVIRKGFYYEHEEYSYKIENNILFLSIPGTESESQTQHPILEVKKDKVVLDNMYITTGFLDNSGTFIKQ